MKGLARASLRFSRGVVSPRLVCEAGFVQTYQDQNIQGNSLDLRVRDVFEAQGELILGKDFRTLPQYHLLSPQQDDSGEWYLLYPNRRYQVEFIERVSLPGYLCGVTMVRSTMAKSGCSGESGLFDSGYEGSTGMMITVASSARIQRGARVAQMVFHRAHSHQLYSGFYQSSVSPHHWKREEK